MPESIYIFTHLAAVSVGYGWGRYATHRALEKVVLQRVDSDESLGGDTEKEEKRHSIGLWLLVAATVLIGIGSQSLLAQRDAREANERREANFECLAEWSDQFANALSQRAGYTEQVARAQQDRDDSIDQILLLLAKSYEEPGSVDDATAREVLEDFVQVQSNLTEVRRDQAKARQESPYPPPPSETCIN